MAMIRPATLADASAIAHVHVEAWRSAYRSILPAEFLANLSKDKRRLMWEQTLTELPKGASIVVAEQDGVVNGFSSHGPERTADAQFTGEVYALYLLDEHRGLGLGTGLLHASCAALHSCGMNSLKIWVLKDNPYRAFYARNGGVEVGEATIMIAGLELVEVAYGWPSIVDGLPVRPRPAAAD